MKKIGILLILTALALVLTLALAGCGTKEPTTAQSSTTPASTETKTSTPPVTQPETTPAKTAAPSPQEPATPEAPAVQTDVTAPDASAEDVDPSKTFSKSIQILQSLSGYRYTTTMKYEGIDDSVADSGTVEIHGEYSAPDRYHMTITDSSEGTRSEFVKIGNELWVNDDGVWTKVPEMAVTAMSQSIFSFGLDFVWGTLAEGLETGANFVGKETVNETKSLHYSSTNSDWEKSIDAGFGNAHGDIWVAEAGYPVKFVFTASGTDEDGNSGSIEWRSDVTDVDSQVTISAPTEE